MDNPNPLSVISSAEVRQRTTDATRALLAALDEDDGPPPPAPGAAEVPELTAAEIFEYIRHLTDPEHPLTLEQLGVVSPGQIRVSRLPGARRRPFVAAVEFTPTIPHCSQAALIGLMIKLKLARCLPREYRVQVSIAEGSHNTEESVNKQLQDKERVAAAFENPNVSRVIGGALLARADFALLAEYGAAKGWAAAA